MNENTWEGYKCRHTDWDRCDCICHRPDESPAMHMAECCSYCPVCNKFIDLYKSRKV